MSQDRIRGVIGVFNAIRFRVEPRDVPAEHAARRLGVDLDVFLKELPNLLARGFPAADRNTGNFDLDAIDQWRRARHKHLFDPATPFAARDASTVVQDRIAAIRGERH